LESRCSAGVASKARSLTTEGFRTFYGDKLLGIDCRGIVEPRSGD
jgi:hypothetical protein